MSADQTSGGPTAPETQTNPVDVAGIIARAEAEHSASAASGAKRVIEAQRRFRAAAEAYLSPADPNDPVRAVLDHCLDHADTITPEQAELYIAQAAAKRTAPILAVDPMGFGDPGVPHPQMSAHTGGARVHLRQDQADKRADGLALALAIKGGLETDRKRIEEARAGDLLAMSLTDLMARELRAAGYRISGTREDVARAYVRALPIMAAGPSHGTDHLPSVLGNIAQKSAMAGWDAAPEVWSQWTQSGTLTNYQTATRTNLALLDKLTKMLENQEWEYGDMADVKQRITGYFYGLKYALSIQAMVNDDVGELVRTMQGWGEAASATVGDVVHAVLFTAGSGGYGQSMDEDSTLLFHADHSNYVASGSGGAPSEETLNTARGAMMTQTDPNGRKVAVQPRYLIHGPSLFSTVRKVLNSQELQSVTVDGSTGATVLTGATNTARDMNLVPIEEYRLVASAPAATTWLLAAARRTVEVAGVGGPVAPRAEQSMISNIPGITYELSMPFGVAALDFRGLYFNYGA